MQFKNIYKIGWVLLAVLMVNCTSVKKYNAHLKTKIPVAQLQKDINYVEKKLSRLHPSLDWYISKENLAKKFDSLRNEIHQPLTPNEFYLAISPVVASVKQGHMLIMPLLKQKDKKEAKALEKLGKHPLNAMTFRYQDDKLFLLKNYSKDTLLIPGSKIISISDIEPKKLYEKYNKTYTSDGFNKTLFPYAFSNRFAMYAALENPVKDSVKMVLQYKDSIYERTVTRAIVKEKDSLKKEDNKPIVAKLTKEELVSKALKAKKEKLKNKLFLYNESTKEYVRNLSYVASDSSIAILKIKGFKHSQHKKAYDSIFKEINSKKVKTLVLDLRYNGGGSLAEIHDLYGYFTTDYYTLIDTIKVTNRTSTATNILRPIPKLALGILSPIVVPFTAYNMLKVKKDKNGNFYSKNKANKLTEPKAERFDGKLYVLINGGSFSASCILSSNLKNANRATFVGEETGGTYNGTVAGLMPILTLPNSKLKFRIGLKAIGPVQKTDVFGHGIFPDVEIIPTIEQIEQGKDPELDWIIEDVKKSKS